MNNVPPPVSKPGRVMVYAAQRPYEQSGDSFSVKEGDLIFAIEIPAIAGDAEGYREVRCRNVTGKLPCSFLEDAHYACLIEFPLHEAAKRGDLELLQECLQNKVSANSLDKSGSTPLYWASHGGHDEAVKSLLEIPNVTVSPQNKLGDTPLHAAAWKGKLGSAQLLIEAGADVHIRNKAGKKPVDLATAPEVASLISLTMATRNETENGDNGESSSSGDEEVANE